MAHPGNDPYRDSAWLIAPEDFARIVKLQKGAGDDKRDKVEKIKVRKLKFTPTDPTVSDVVVSFDPKERN